MPSGGVLAVDATPAGFGPGDGAYIDYVVDVPAALGADVRSASGPIAVSGLGGPVRIETASGSVEARDLSGSATIASVSGGIRMFNIAGDLWVSSVSGSVLLRFTPAASAHIDATTTSGSVTTSGLQLSDQSSGAHSLSGNLNGGGPTVSVRTTSGSIQLLRGS